MREKLSNELLFGKIVRQLRNQKGLSQEQLADLCELDRTYISLIERGLRQPTLKTIFRIANSLQITPSELIHHVEGDWNENIKN
ncbi:helix-turn-helix domain-containing protein [Treponema zuelzerae]|jgi:transcriptional regulator with XRE-family HTH domain|uniref:Helix-turn-helix domain-containing protein n=1 Tax=Teretinema zuelzerae TaxID=156 RepID=A0AAE3JJX0_9SPIR|nr:helix-turn-helix transcriptional regulator [Teretinema zuelzerae]MCD1655978.1 helix-turn-helix domain-containing protein [Teretinema zuelzerae]